MRDLRYPHYNIRVIMSKRLHSSFSLWSISAGFRWVMVKLCPLYDILIGSILRSHVIVSSCMATKIIIGNRKSAAVRERAKQREQTIRINPPTQIQFINGKLNCCTGMYVCTYTLATDPQHHYITMTQFINHSLLYQTSLTTTYFIIRSLKEPTVI